MDLITPSTAAAGVRAAGQITSAVIGSYRPTGVPRLGSKEDRASAYRRLLDASTRAFNCGYMYGHMNRTAGRAAHKLLIAQMPTVWEATAELISALNGVRLCGTVQVITAAEELVKVTGDLDMNERKANLAQKQADRIVEAQKVFLEACREDLAYNTRWWQVIRKRKERKFLREQSERSQNAARTAALRRQLARAKSGGAT
ncbi:hypothetical protein [Streptomyces wuyuanensis]|uniref:hypothetical protein n=1 Tax=Streptomyces wuyuanensis TaxID=1196353 RepID=UPI0034212297